MINVFLVDDHELVRTGIRRILEDVRGIKVIGEASCGEDAVQFCRDNQPDVILMDMNMPGIGGLEATRKILRKNPDVKIIVLTIHTEEPFPSKVMQAGGAGYLTKGAGPEEVLAAIRKVHSGQRYIAPEIAQQMALSQFCSPDENPFQSLSERELQIMLMITKGQKVVDIAEQLHLNSKTVNAYRYRLFNKLNISGDVELTHLAIRHGILDSDTLYVSLTPRKGTLDTAFDPQAFLNTVPHQPGVYRMYDNSDTVIYVGKAKDLHKRLSSYFRKQVDREKTRVLVSHIAHVDVTITHTETEALVLEHTYIKRYQPRYNVSLRDDKSYPYILLTDHKHPQLTSIRGSKKRAGLYFGPYPSGGAVRDSLHLMQKLFPIRQCEDSYYQNRSRPCLQYQLKRCLAPCVPMADPDEYQQQVDLAVLFLKGKDQDAVRLLVKKMEQASQALEFEAAAKYRDQIQALRTIQEQQYVTSDLGEMDVIGFALKNGLACVYILFIREGKVFGSRSYFPKMPASADINEIIQAFLLQFYLNEDTGRAIPREIVLNVMPEDSELITTTLTDIAEHKVKLICPKRGDRERFVQLASTNANSALTSKLATKSTVLHRFKALEQVLEMTDKIQRMECFDISHTGGEQTVASCVVFNREGPNKAEYRYFNISGITGGDDYAAMAQALERRFKNVTELEKIPDILFIDGGKGQMAQAEQVLAKYADNFSEKKPLVIGIAKGVTRKPGLETLILGGSYQEFFLPGDSPALHLVQHIRDESHRFAITGHRGKRNKVKRTSALEAIPGVGPKRRQSLLKFMGGLQQLRRASMEEIAKVPGISTDLAEKIYDSLHR